MVLDPETWKTYLEQASERQNYHVDRLNFSMVMLLLFARLMRMWDRTLGSLQAVCCYCVSEPCLARFVPYMLLTLKSQERSYISGTVPDGE